MVTTALKATRRKITSREWESLTDVPKQKLKHIKKFILKTLVHNSKNLKKMNRCTYLRHICGVVHIQIMLM